MNNKFPVVNTHNEWDPLEEVIVGIVDGATVPPWETVTPAVVHHEYLLDFYRQNGGKPWPQELLDAAQKDIDELVHILEAEGVTVRRPSIYGTGKSFSTPDFESQSSCGALRLLSRRARLPNSSTIIIHMPTTC